MLRDTTSAAYKARNEIISANMKKRWADKKSRAELLKNHSTSKNWHGLITWRGVEYKSRAQCFKAARKLDISRIEVEIELGIRGKQTYGGTGFGFNAREVTIDGVYYPSLAQAHRATGVCARILAEMSTTPRWPESRISNFHRQRPITLFSVKYKSQVEAQQALKIPNCALRILAGTMALPKYEGSIAHVFMRKLCEEHGMRWNHLTGKICRQSRTT